MNQYLFYGGFLAGGCMLVVTVVLYVRLHIGKAFADVFAFGAKKRWTTAPQKGIRITRPLSQEETSLSGETTPLGTVAAEAVTVGSFVTLEEIYISDTTEEV